MPSLARLFLFRLLLLFTLAFPLSFSFPYYNLIPDIGSYLAPVLEPITTTIGKTVFNKDDSWRGIIESDSSGMWIIAGFVLLLAALAALLWTFISKKHNDRIAPYWHTILRYYLALHLLHYGCNKLFKWQFFLPEPNTLYTPLGELSPDLLYWSLMGLSRPYVIFLGAVETFAALLLLFRRTTLAGALLAGAILINILAVNLAFDISVKLYACFLLLLSCLLLLPFQGYLKALLTLQFPSNGYKPWINRPLPLKWLVIFLVLADVLLPYFKTGNWNDDRAVRPPLHGAYEVVHFIHNGDTLPPLLTDTYRWRRVFIHRQQYLIVQGMDDALQDYHLHHDTTAKILRAVHTIDSSEVSFTYERLGDSLYQWKAVEGTDSLRLLLKTLPWKNGPALQPSLNWSVD